MGIVKIPILISLQSTLLVLYVCIYLLDTVTHNIIGISQTLNFIHRQCSSCSNLLVGVLLHPLLPDGLLLRPHHLPLLERPLHQPLLVHLHSDGLFHGPCLPFCSGQALLLKPDKGRGEVNLPRPEAQQLQCIVVNILPCLVL